MDPDWLRWVKRLAAIAQDGLPYATDGYDLGRYEQLREVVAEILASHSTGSIERARKLLELETGPATPKVDVRAAVFRGDRILLVKEPEDGGWSDVGETAAEGAVREVYEESGYRVRAVRLFSAYDRDRHDHPPSPTTSTSSSICARYSENPSPPTSRRTAWASSASTSFPRSRSRASPPPK